MRIPGPCRFRDHVAKCPPMSDNLCYVNPLEVPHAAVSLIAGRNTHPSAPGDDQVSTSAGTGPIPQAAANCCGVSPSAEFMSQRPNGGQPSGSPPP